MQLSESIILAEYWEEHYMQERNLVHTIRLGQSPTSTLTILSCKNKQICHKTQPISLSTFVGYLMPNPLYTYIIYDLLAWFYGILTNYFRLFNAKFS